MSSSLPSFIALAVGGRIDPDQIDDFVDRWHETDGGGSLHDYLGLTNAEYALWLVEPDMLATIVRARAEVIPLPVMVHDILAHRRGSRSLEDVGRDERLDRWLALQTARD